MNPPNSGAALGFLVVANLLLVILAPRPTSAANPDPRAAARADLIKGMNQLDQGEYAAALRSFEAAYALVPSPKIFYNMGLAYQAMERNAKALENFDRFLKEATDVPQDKSDQAQQYRRQLLAKVAAITVTTDAPGTDISVDGEQRGQSPLGHPLYVDPGNHQIVAQRSGLPSVVQNFSATAGGSQTIDIAFNKPLDGTPLPTQPPVISLPMPQPEQRPLVAAEGSPKWRRPAKWTAAGLAVVGVGFGIIETFAARNKSKEFNSSRDGCMDNGKGLIEPTEACRQIDRDQASATHAAIIGYGLGGALAITAGILQFFDVRERKKLESASLTCDPNLGIGGFSCVAHW